MSKRWAGKSASFRRSVTKRRVISIALALLAPVVCLLLIERLWGSTFAQDIRRSDRFDITAGLLGYTLAMGGLVYRNTNRFLSRRKQPFRLRRVGRVRRKFLFVFLMALLASAMCLRIAGWPGARSVLELALILLLGMALVLPDLSTAERKGAIIRRITRRIGSFESEGLPRVCYTYEEHLNKTLDDVLDVAARTPLWAEMAQLRCAPTAILFAPHCGERHFIPIAVRSPVQRFNDIAWGLRPAFLDLDRFCEFYQRYCKDRASPGSLNTDPSERVRQFRKDTRQFSSTSALVAGRGRPFFFEDVFYKCLTFDFNFLSEIDDLDDRKRLQFRNLVGFPVRFDGDLMGVMLLLGDRFTRFHPDLALYEQLQDILGHLLDVGRSNRLLRPEVMEALEKPPAFVDFRSFSRLTNQMNPHFDTLLEEDLVEEVKSILLDGAGKVADSDSGFIRGPVQVSLEKLA